MGDTDENGKEGLTIVSRAEWGARDTLSSEPLRVPVGIVFVHHTMMSDRLTLTDYKADMRMIQDFHMDTRGWDDIGYSFLAAEDGMVYEGRGWRRVGAHTLSWNDVSLAISVIGDYSDRLPTEPALNAVHGWIKMGVKLGYIKPDYELYGHRDTNPSTSCPGDRLYTEISTWGHYDHNPPVHPNRPAK